MAEQPRSPFAGLDKALLRSTQTPAPVAPDTAAGTADARALRKNNRVAPDTHPAGRKPAAQPASDADSNVASTIASTVAIYPEELVAAIRKVVRVPGREVSFVRLTPDEKSQLGDIVYAYKRRGKKTTENEINRIAVNFILEDYRAHGEQSILARVIDALLA